MIRLEVAAVRGEEIPDCWAVDGAGKVTTDPRTAMREGAGLPLGGSELTGGYKGYGLALMVETLCGVMAGGTWGPNIRQWAESSSPGGSLPLLPSSGPRSLRPQLLPPPPAAPQHLQAAQPGRA